MKKLVIATLFVLSCSQAPHRLGFAAPPPGPAPQLVRVTWGPQTAICGGVPGILLDGGATRYQSDPITQAGVVVANENSISYFCNVPAFGAVEDSVSAVFSNDAIAWAPATIPNTAAATPVALIDGGIGDGGTPGVILLGQSAVPYSGLVLTHLGAMTYDAGFFCDAGPQGPSIIGACDAGTVSIYIDAGTNFCDGGNFCDAGPNSYTVTDAVCLTCNAVSVAH